MDVEPTIDTCCALWIEKVKQGSYEVGLAVLSPRGRVAMNDKRNLSLVLYEFGDNDQLSNIESLLVQVTPVRCHYLEMSANQIAERRKLSNMLEVLGIQAKESKRARFSVQDVEQDLRIATGEETLAAYSQELEKRRAVRATACLLRVEDILRGGNAAGNVALSLGSLGQFMKLDSAAVAALNLLPSPEDPNKEASVHGVLDHCMKRIGSRLLTQWLRQPLLDLDTLRARQRLVCLLNDETEQRDAIRACLKTVPDLDIISRRLELERSKLEDLYKLYTFAINLPKMAEAIRAEGAVEEENCGELEQFAARIDHLTHAGRFGKFIQLVENVIDLDIAPSEFRVRTCNDPSGELQSIAKQIEKAGTQRNF